MIKCPALSRYTVPTTFAGQMLRKTLRRAHVLIYNRGQDQEGVYTLYAEVSDGLED